MALYSYRAFTKGGKEVQGTLDASSLAAVRDQLVKQDLLPAQIVLEDQKAKRSWWKNLFAPKVTLRDKIFFTKQLAVLLRAGIPLFDALDLLIEQTDKGLRIIVGELKETVKEGSSLADALAKYPNVFDTTYIQLVRAGEATGRLELILERLTAYLTQSEELAKKVRAAIRKPLTQLVIIFGVVVLLLVAVVPNIAEVFAEGKAELPFATRMLMGMSDFMSDYYLVILGILGAALGFFFWWRTTAAGARVLDSLKLRLPVVGYFARMSAVVQFSRTLGMLVEGGVNLAESLGIVCKVVDNRVLVDTLNEARENIIKQGKIADYLKQTKLFPPLALYLINTGEKSGQLDTMLLAVAETYERELQDYADNLTAKVVEYMPLVMGLIVGFVVFAIVKPMVSLGSLVDQGPDMKGVL